MRKSMTKYEALSVYALFDLLKDAEDRKAKALEKFKAPQEKIDKEFDKWNTKGTPDIKVIGKAIEDQKKVIDDFRQATDELFAIRAEIIRKTGIKEQELPKFYEVLRYTKVLQQADDFYGAQ